MWFLVIAAGIVIAIVAALLAGRARRAGHPALGGFIDSASFPVSVAFLWVVLGLALNHVDWTFLAAIPLGYAVWAVLRTLRRRRDNA